LVPSLSNKYPLDALPVHLFRDLQRTQLFLNRAFWRVKVILLN